MFVLRFEESAVQTDRRRPAQRQVETRTTAPRVLRHLAVKNTTGGKSTKDQTFNLDLTLTHTFNNAEVKVSNRR